MKNRKKEIYLDVKISDFWLEMKKCCSLYWQMEGQLAKGLLIFSNWVCVVMQPNIVQIKIKEARRGGLPREEKYLYLWPIFQVFETWIISLELSCGKRTVSDKQNKRRNLKERHCFSLCYWPHKEEDGV